MINVLFRIPSYGMYEFEKLMEIDDIGKINSYPRLKCWPNVLGVEYKFILPNGDDITSLVHEVYKV